MVRMWLKLKRLCASCVRVLQRGNSGDGSDLALTLCKYDLRKLVKNYTHMELGAS